jgi:hypothetical protein
MQKGHTDSGRDGPAAVCSRINPVVIGVSGSDFKRICACSLVTGVSVSEYVQV